LKKANVMFLCLKSSLCALPDPGGADGAIVTRRLLFPSLTKAPMPQGTDTAGPAVRLGASAFLSQR
jgi:hypothetical protein